MKKQCLFLVGALCACAQVSAQSSVTLYGLISDGLTWANNEGGAHSYRLLSGSNQNNRVGFKINEDLGGGTQAIAQLENGFDINNGRFGQGGRMFGRQAFVGLSDTRFGTLTVGRQYDMFWDYLTQFAAGVANTGLLATPGDADNLMGSWRYNNSIKYRSANVGGFDAEAMYAFSNAAGQFSVNRAFSAGARYVHGPYQIAVAYVEIDQPGTTNANGAVTDDYAGAPFFLFRTSPLNASAGVKRQRNYGIGGRYDVGYGVRLNAVIDAIRYAYSDGTSLSLDNYDVSVSYTATPALTFAAGYIYTSGRYGGLDANPHWNGAQISVDYSLSKRTDVYLFDTFQRKSGPHAVADVYLYAPSTSSNQNVVVAGIRHRF
ncbi:porin [Paraburkholderia sp. J67]|uniref:porin n=1 Tax=Paraburkholderia sp. J67 TaxID=2805435 RepID=UPI002ABDF2B3|nr:porin [Paraburkholderia sp. J67]